MHHIHRSLSKNLPLDNEVILLGADVVFIVAAEMMEKELGDQGAVCLISEFDGLMV